jgi:hypothetical protein
LSGREGALFGAVQALSVQHSFNNDRMIVEYTHREFCSTRFTLFACNILAGKIHGSLIYTILADVIQTLTCFGV